ncbi:MAG: hypothetical protein ACLSWI_05350, partial [Candidatus Gastranaerophilaceae bacterium]
MAISIDNQTGDIKIYQGDTGEIIINGIPQDQNYKVFFAVQDSLRNPVGTEIMVNSNNLASVAIKLTSELTNMLKVPKNKSVEVYQYGIKICTPGSMEENTLFIGNTDFGDVNNLFVYP